MDYKYIEQLLERYWECQTTLEEEAILRAFFAQNDLPARLLPYRDLFLAEDAMANDRLGDDFDHRLMKRLEKEVADTERTVTPSVSLRPITLSRRLAPLFRAAAIVAIVVAIGMAAQQGFHHDEVNQTPQYAQGENQSDTLMLFTDMPQPSDKAEASLSVPPVDTLIKNTFSHTCQ